MAKLDLSLQLSSPDEIYRALIDLIDQVGDDSGPGAMAALSLTLANQIGNDEIVLEAIDFVRNAYASADSSDARPAPITDALTAFFGNEARNGSAKT